MNFIRIFVCVAGVMAWIAISLFCLFYGALNSKWWLTAIGVMLLVLGFSFEIYGLTYLGRLK